MVASSNDYGTCCDQFYTTLDNAATWATGNMSRNSPQVTGSDPVTVFDVKNGTVIHTSLNYSFQLPTGEACRGDLTASVSTDGGITWRPPVVVHTGVGCDLSNVQLFNDKEWVVTDNNPSSPFYGRTYLTWTVFESPPARTSGRRSSSRTPTMAASIGRRRRRSLAQMPVSARSRLLVRRASVTRISSLSQRWVPMAPFTSPSRTSKTSYSGSQVRVEKTNTCWLSRRTADRRGRAQRSLSASRMARATYPINVSGRQTLTGYQLRVNSAGNIVASPANGNLYLVFSDNRNGTHDSANPVTNTDVFLMTSANGGSSWSGPTQVDSAAGDQWFPWVDVNPTNGNIGIVYNDRGSSNGALYNASLMEVPGSKILVSTAPSDPTQSRYFQAGVTGCANCATFNGDYINISYGSNGKANIAWTDMRDPSDIPGLFYQFIYYAQH